MARARQREMTYTEAVRHALKEIIDADLPLQETRTAVMFLIPEEYHIAHNGPLSVRDGAGDALAAPQVARVLPRPSKTHASPFRQAAKSRLNGDNNHVLISAGTDRCIEW